MNGTFGQVGGGGGLGIRVLLLSICWSGSEGLDLVGITKMVKWWSHVRGVVVVASWKKWEKGRFFKA